RRPPVACPRNATDGRPAATASQPHPRLNPARAGHHRPMHRIAPVLLAVGLVAAIGLPFTLGRAPVIVGALLIVAVAPLAQRCVPLAIVVGVALILAPGIINARLNWRGIAWDVPQDEHVLLAERGSPSRATRTQSCSAATLTTASRAGTSSCPGRR